MAAGNHGRGPNHVFSEGCLLRYGSETGGLRAVAVPPVILFHAGLGIFGGGFVGVDVFFVISGYLITTILFEDLAGGRFSLLGFYERRARRHAGIAGTAGRNGQDMGRMRQPGQGHPEGGQ